MAPRGMSAASGDVRMEGAGVSIGTCIGSPYRTELGVRGWYGRNNIPSSMNDIRNQS